MLRLRSITWLGGVLLLALVSQPLFTAVDNGLGKVEEGVIPKSATMMHARENNAEAHRSSSGYGKLPIYFEPNLGQTDSQVKFIARGSGVTTFLTATEAVFSLPTGDFGLPNGKESIKRVGYADLADWEQRALRISPWNAFGRSASSLGPTTQTPRSPQSAIENRRSVISMKLVGSNLNAMIDGLDRLPGISNYFIGNDPKKWQTNIPHYAKVRYRNVYRGIDLSYYGSPQELEYDFILAPGASLQAIQLDFDGADHVEVAGNGALLVNTTRIQLRHKAPRIYQEDSGGQKRIDGGFVVRSGGKVGFETKPFDVARAVIIDPVIEYSTFLGGSNIDQANSIAVHNGSAYVAGYTISTDFPSTAGSFRRTLAGNSTYDVVVTALNPGGSALLFSTYFGGDRDDFGAGVAVDLSGSVIVTGRTTSSNLPTTAGALDTSYNGGSCFGGSPCEDAFVVKLNSTGSALQYSTYLGGTSNDAGWGLTVDASGNAFVTGGTESSNFPRTAGAFQQNLSGTRDAFVAKLSSDGRSLIFATYLRGSEIDQGNGIAIDKFGNAYIAGNTASANFPTTAGVIQPAYQPGACGFPSSAPCNDVFIAKLNPAGSSLIYSTLLGGSSGDVGYGIAVDDVGNVLATGLALSSNFPTTPALFATPAAPGFVAKLNPTATELIYSIQGVGGNSIATDRDGNAYVTGQGASFHKLGPAGQLLCSTCLAGRSGGVGYGIAVDPLGATYVAGAAFSADFRTVKAYQGQFGGSFSDSYAAKISVGDSITFFVPVVLSTPGANNSFYTSELTLTNRGSKDATLDFLYTAAVGDGSGSASASISAGRQVILPDAIAYLKSIGIPIPEASDHQGTLRVQFSGLASSSDATVTVRTTTAVSGGRAGLAYAGIPLESLLTGPVYLCGLRQNSTDRSNLAIQNGGTPVDGDIRLRLTVFSGDPVSPLSQQLPEEILSPGAFRQFNSILTSNGLSLSQGYVRVERVSGTAPYYAYAVINDQSTSDGSFIPPVEENALRNQEDLLLPVIVETSAFSSELILTNWSSVPKKLFFFFVSEGIQTQFSTASFSIDLQSGQQLLIPNLVQWMREQGVDGVGPVGPTYAGPLLASPTDFDARGIFLGARTSTRNESGSFGVSYTSVPPYTVPSCAASAWVLGLQQNSTSRSNLALVNFGDRSADSLSGKSLFTIEIFNGDTGLKVHSVEGIEVGPRRWLQLDGLLSRFSPATAQGYARVTQISGTNSFITYAVINDGAAPSERTGDGAFIASSP